jgi:hypothetical protein
MVGGLLVPVPGLRDPALEAPVRRPGFSGGIGS